MYINSKKVNLEWAEVREDSIITSGLSPWPEPHFSPTGTHIG